MTPANTAAPVPAEPSVMDVLELGEELKCSPRHVYRMVENGLIPPPAKLGSLNRWPRSVIDRWIEAGCPPVRKK